jgi:hypothetical protein
MVTHSGQCRRLKLDRAFSERPAVAQADALVGIVGLDTAPTYEGAYVSNFPEYNEGTDGERLLYNAVPCYALSAFPDGLYLRQMVQVVPGEHADDVGNRLLAALLVHAIVLPQILG